MTNFAGLGGCAGCLSYSSRQALLRLYTPICTKTDAAALPADVFTAINNQPFNAALTDIRPEDAKFAVARALAPLSPNRNGLGYGPGPIGAAIHSVVSTASVTPIDFNVTRTDPIMGLPVPAYKTSSVGAAPVVVFVNKSNLAAGGLGSTGASGKPHFTNIGSSRDPCTCLMRHVFVNAASPIMPHVHEKRARAVRFMESDAA